MQETILKGVEYVLSKQLDDGSWTDFCLPPGRSDMWVTAYIGLKLKTTLDGLKIGEFDDQLMRAADWLDRTRSKEGGWGYNRSCPTDSDSSSFALLFLHSMSREISPEYCDMLSAYVRPDGGVSTYLQSDVEDAWGISHPDVTPVTGLAFHRVFPGSRKTVSRMMGFVKGSQNGDGLWSSYWWNTPLYSTLQNLDFALETGTSVELGALRATLSKTLPKAAFDIALDLHCRKKLSMPCHELTAMLADIQEDDGSWISVPMLRVTYANIAKPWLVEKAGELYADVDRLFTTVTVLASLTED